MCPPLLSDNLDIECSYNNNYANCSNLSMPNTIAIPSCKRPYTLPNGQEEVPPELLCQPNGMWDKELYSCILCNCIFCDIIIISKLKKIIYICFTNLLNFYYNQMILYVLQILK